MRDLVTCPCCGYRTPGERGDYGICPICYWEDDPFQYENPDAGQGANPVSLRDAQKNSRRLVPVK